MQSHPPAHLFPPAPATPQVRSHKQFPFNAITKAPHGKTVLNTIKDFLQPMFDVGYRVADVIMVGSVGNMAPYHQDKFTGAPTFQRVGVETGAGRVGVGGARK